MPDWQQMSDGALKGSPHWCDEMEEPKHDTCPNEGCPEEGSSYFSSNQKPAGQAKRGWTDGSVLPHPLGGISLDLGTASQDPGGHRLGAFLTSSVGGHVSTAASRRWTTAPRRAPTDLPCCTVQPTFCSAPRKYTRKRKLPGTRSALEQNMSGSYNLASGVSNRMLLHPSFQSYYTAVARWGSGAKESVCGPRDTFKDSSQQEGTDGAKDQSVLPINTCDFFYTDPLLPPGHRVYNCLSSSSQQVFKNFRLDTPAPIMSVCESDPLPAVKLAEHAEKHSQEGRAPGYTDDAVPHRGKTKTKWLSLAEYIALNALLDMPHQDSAHAADSLPLTEPMLWTPGRMHDISKSSLNIPSTSDTSRGDAPARDSLGFGISSAWDPLHSQDQDHHKIRIPNVWNDSEQSARVAQTMDTHMPQAHIETQRNHATPKKSSPRVYKKKGFPHCPSTRQQKVKSHIENDHFGVLTPMYQLKIHGHKNREPSERIKADEVSGAMRLTEPLPPASGHRSNLYCVQESDTAVTMLELHSLVPVNEGVSLAADTSLTR